MQGSGEEKDRVPELSGHWPMGWRWSWNEVGYGPAMFHRETCCLCAEITADVQGSREESDRVPELSGHWPMGWGWSRNEVGYGPAMFHRETLCLCAAITANVFSLGGEGRGPRIKWSLAHGLWMVQELCGVLSSNVHRKIFY